MPSRNTSGGQNDIQTTYREVLKRVASTTLEVQKKRAILIQLCKSIHKPSRSFKWKHFLQRTRNYNLHKNGTSIYLDSSNSKLWQINFTLWCQFMELSTDCLSWYIRIYIILNLKEIFEPCLVKKTNTCKIIYIID